MSRFTNTNSFNAFTTNVVVSGTPVQLANNAVPPGIAIVVKARSTNTGTVTVGNSSANALNTATNNQRLLQNQSLELEVQNTNSIWVDATVAGEGVEVIFEQ